MASTQTDVHPSAIGSDTRPTTDNSWRRSNTSNVDDDTPNSEATNKQPGTEYPEQKHAGRVGYGPHYHQGPGFTDKVTGFKEMVVGKVTKNPDLVQQGHGKMTGESKMKELEADMNEDPFATAEKKQ